MQHDSNPGLGARLLQAIQKEALMQSPLPLEVGASEAFGRGEVHVEVLVADGDRFSRVLGRFAARLEPATSKRAAPPAPLTASKLAEKVKYLAESLQVVELQPDESVLLRSAPEEMRGRGSDYFEGVVVGNGFEIRRYTPREGGGRDEKAFCLPDDVLARLADDAASILGAA